jgi:hypothetical protein
VNREVHAPFWEGPGVQSLRPTQHRVHWCLDVALNDDQMRARMKNAGANLAIVRRLVLNLFRLDKSRKGGLHTRRILAASSDSYREALLGLDSV